MNAYIPMTIRVSEEIAGYLNKQKEKSPRSSYNDLLNDLLEYAIREKTRKRKKHDNRNS